MMKNIAYKSLVFAFVIGVLVSTFAGEVLAQKKKTKLDTPTVTLAGATASSITLNVKAGTTGAPAGFSVQWMTLADYQANGNQFYSSDVVCKASFSGNANGSRYNLGPGESVQVTIGDTLLDAGASVGNCGGEPLVCDTAYVFRVFAHANNTLERSDFAIFGLDGSLRTIPCSAGGGCTFTQGYWKTHGPIPTGGNTNMWPVGALSLGSVTYSDLELLSILNTPSAGNGLVNLAHQLIAAKLNVANGADDAAIAGSILDADALIGGLIVPPIGSGALEPGDTSSLVNSLTSYNEGATGPGHCQ
jgi:hypothetical protein